jgi:hypothetical protein
MRTLYVKAKNGKFAGSLPNPRAIVLPRPTLPTYPKPQIETIPQSNGPDKDIHRWDLATAKNIGLPEEVRIYSTAQEKLRAKKIAGLTFIGIQASFVGGVSALTASLGGSPAASIVALIGLPVTIALASLPAREYYLANKGYVANAEADRISNK